MVMLLATLTFFNGAAHAAEDDDGPSFQTAFLEAQVAWGVQFGTTPYVPMGDGTSFEHPFTNGPAFGATAGVAILPYLAGVIGYDFTFATSRSGEVENVLDEIDGTISYHTLVIGARPALPLGPGRLVTEFAVGVVLPFETRLEYTYGPALGQLPEPLEPITGEGTRITEYNLALGAQGLIGYHLPIVKNGPYIGLNARLRSFTTNNNGEEQRLDNFVTDLTAQPPTAVTTTIEFDKDDGVQPTTYSVQDLRGQLVVGMVF